MRSVDWKPSIADFKAAQAMVDCEGKMNSSNQIGPVAFHRITGARVASDQGDLPLTVRDAARFLGVSPQTVYLWVERKQIPHLRVMGRNIRFLKSDLEPFRASFKQEMENGKTK